MRLAALALAALCWLAPLLAPLAQDMAQVRRDIDSLASPRFFGRGYLKGGDRLAAQWIAQRFAQMGLQSFPQGFSQDFWLDVNTFPKPPRLRVGKAEMQAGADFIVDALAATGRGKGRLLRFDPQVLDPAKPAARLQFLATPLAGRVLMISAQEYYQLLELPVELLRHVHQAEALLSVDEKLTMSVADRQLARPWFHLRRNRFDSTAQKVHFELQAELLQGYRSQNVVGYVRGTRQPEKFIVFTAHYDHLGGMGSTYFPGANDNASGTALLLALAQHYARQPAPYSVAFMAFGGEEAGLVGSRHYTEQPMFPLSQIQFLINLDLVGTGDEGITVVNGAVHTAEFGQLQRIATEKGYFNRVLKRGLAANSDHYFFGKKGVKCFFIYTLGGIQAYHDIHDRPETLPLTKFGELYALLRDFAEGLMKE